MDVVTEHNAIFLMRASKEMAYLMKMGPDTDICSFPATPTLIAIVGDIVCIRPRAIRKCWYDFLNACWIAL